MTEIFTQEEINQIITARAKWEDINTSHQQRDVLWEKLEKEICSGEACQGEKANIKRGIIKILANLQSIQLTIDDIREDGNLLYAIINEQIREVKKDLLNLVEK